MTNAATRSVNNLIEASRLIRQRHQVVSHNERWLVVNSQDVYADIAIGSHQTASVSPDGELEPALRLDDARWITLLSPEIAGPLAGLIGAISEEAHQQQIDGRPATDVVRYAQELAEKLLEASQRQ